MKRDGTVGAPAILAAWVRITSRAPSNWAKSCAERPMRRSGRSRPSSSRIGRLSQASVWLSGGQVPSTRPPSTTRSLSVRRASSRPRMRTRRPGWLGRRTTRPAKSRGKQFDIVRSARRASWRPHRLAASSSSASASFAPSRPGESDFVAVLQRQRGQHVAMARGELAERQWRVGRGFSNGSSASAEPGDQIGSGGQFGIGQCVARVGAMQAVFALAKCFERVGQAARSSARTRPAQDRALERGDRALPVPPSRAAAADV